MSTAIELSQIEQSGLVTPSARFATTGTTQIRSTPGESGHPSHSNNRPNDTGSDIDFPNGGLGWIMVFCCATMNFFFTGFSGSWGVIQAALLRSSLQGTSPSTVSWIGSLSLGCVVAFGILAVRLLPLLGARPATLFGSALFSLSILASGFVTENLAGLFATCGALAGLGVSILFMITNTIPAHYFDSSAGGRLGLANGLIKLGGGIGAAVWSIALEALISRVGIAWTLRIYGMLSFTVTAFASWPISGRLETKNTPLFDITLFRNFGYTAVFLAGAICVFALYVPPFFLPLFTESSGYSSKIGSGILAGFNLAAAAGRFGAGPLCDRIGSVNTLLITLSLNAASMLALWPVSNSIPLLVVFALTNGVANGAFFTCMPTVVTNLVGHKRSTLAMGMANTGWTAGYLLGAPIAGYLLPGVHATVNGSIAPYRSAIFYAGGTATFAAFVILIARFHMDRRLLLRL